VELLLPIPVFVSLRNAPNQRQFTKCAFVDFQDPEVIGERRYIWTKSRSTVECYFPAPTKLRYAWLEICATGPAGSTVTIMVDHRTVLENHRVVGTDCIRLRLPNNRIYHDLKLRIDSSTFVPRHAYPGSEDGRELGVALRAIVFARSRTKYRAGSIFRTGLYERLQTIAGNWFTRRAA
jgi:hypothetical protein